jgi:hypothetical protein
MSLNNYFNLGRGKQGDYYMKRSFVLGCLMALGLALPTQATVFFTDLFNYENGRLTATDGGADVSGGLWTTHDNSNNPGNEYVEVLDGQAEILNDGAEDVNRIANATMQAGDTWYYATKFIVNDTRLNSANQFPREYFMHFYNGLTGANNRSTARLYVDDPNVASTDHYRLELSSSSIGSGIVTVPLTSVDLEFGTAYTVIASYSYDTGFVSLWLNPEAGEAGTPDITDTAGNANGIQVPITALAMRQFSGGTSNTAFTQILVDAVSLGNNFDEVLAAISPIDPGQSGDFDDDGDVDGRDFLIWQRGGSTPGGPLSASDLADWQTNYGTQPPLTAVTAVPEPASLAILALALAPMACGRKR